MSSLARVGALVATGALVTTGLVSGLSTPAVAATNDPRPVTIAASWLEGQLTNGLLHNDQYDFDDVGLSIDAGLSLAAIGGRGTTVDAISTAVAGNIGSYTSYPGHVIAGSIAKAAVFARAAGDDPASYGGQDLVTELEGRVAGADPIKGRIQDDYTPNPPYEVDFANVVGQAFAVNALSAAHSAKATDAIAFLIDQQCSDGYFRLNFTEDTSAPDQSCDGGIAGGASTPDTDATAMAVLQLEATGSTASNVVDAIARAKAWLVTAQHADGSFGGGASTEGANTNSTGLAGWALGELGDSSDAAKAAAWVRAHQADNASACSDALSRQTGAIGYDDAGVAAGRTDGITTATQDQWRRSTAPTLPVLQWAPAAASPLTLSGPGGFAKAGSTVTYHLSGVAPGATACVSGIGTARRVSPGADGAATVALTMPGGTAVRTVTAASGATSDSAAVQVLDARTFKVRPSRSTVHRGARVHVVVRGLVPGERVTLRLRGRTVKIGKATGHRFVTDVRVGRRLGKAKLVARGQYPALRHGSAILRVVR